VSGPARVLVKDLPGDIRMEEVGRGRPTYEETPDGLRPVESLRVERRAQSSRGTANTPDGQGHSCETKPIARAPGARGRGPARPPLLLPLGQVRQTKPIAPERHEGQVLDGKRVMTSWTHKRPRRNKANCHADRKEQGATRPPAPPAGPSAPNKANSRADRRGQGPSRLPTPSVGPIVRNEANLRTDGCGRPTAAVLPASRWPVPQLL
jgi:hypothetical protein